MADGTKDGAKQKPISEADAACMALAAMEPEFKKALPAQVPSQKFIRVAQTALRTNPSLATLDRGSLWSAFHKSAADGLIPDGREAAIVPFKGKATYMPMIAGILKKARNSGEIKTVNAQVVYARDSYEHWIDEQGEHFKHVPARGDRGEAILTYAFAQTKDGGVFFEEVDMAQMDAIAKMSRAEDGPWRGPFKTEMMRKSALRRLLKYRVPSSTDLDEIIRRDDELYDKPEAQDVPTPAKTTSGRLKDIVDTTAQAHEATEAPDLTRGTPEPQRVAAAAPAARVEHRPEPAVESPEDHDLRVAAGEDVPI